MAHTKYSKVLVAVDLSEASAPVLDRAIELARQLGSAVELVHVREPFDYPLTEGYVAWNDHERVVIDWIDKSLVTAQEAVTRAGLTCTTTSLRGPAASEIVRHARDVKADLIIVGTHGRTGISHVVLGSVAERVVQKAGRPVLVVPTGR
jgi:nucleotide-binding universal stress UspA family protein